MEPVTIAHLLILLLAGIAAVTDVRRGEIPNWLTLPPLVIAPLAWFLVPAEYGGRWWGLGSSVLGALVCAFVPYLLFRARPVEGGESAGGGGDVKLFAAIGAIAHLQGGVEAQLLAFIFAALFALGRAAWEGKLFRVFLNSFFLAANPVLPQRARRTFQSEDLSTIRLGVSILSGAAGALALRYEVIVRALLS